MSRKVLMGMHLRMESQGVPRTPARIRPAVETHGRASSKGKKKLG
ncbi:hypothetical protein Mal4_25400 [Maioricimonas rarisocia]|uniref:Uncharacterized protein n=1 Tax=Maioricimonas rarisocia TaxID=2528026 RepID=A0A517Z6V0_9PLAN|nr:hypothetical protein Mal4_25400 [Maioricimonas rarisocia]